MKKLLLLSAFGAGYVLGAKAGRGRYEEIREKGQELWDSPRVQKHADTVKEKAEDVKAAASEKATDVKDAAGEKAAAVKEKVVVKSSEVKDTASEKADDLAEKANSAAEIVERKAEEADTVSVDEHGIEGKLETEGVQGDTSIGKVS